ncbi:hypothetical protein JVU11DRAFT_3323 [Chiua virens]|nr:hypothetical protein JVU11DRAFT_3323 [Chiua virens]
MYPRETWSKDVKGVHLPDDAPTAVLTVSPDYAGFLIGTGTNGAPPQPFFNTYNITFENRANHSTSQALVTDISYASASFYGCTLPTIRIPGIRAKMPAPMYVADSIIFWQTDCSLWTCLDLALRTSSAAAPGNRYGAYISDSWIIRSPDANSMMATYHCWSTMKRAGDLRTYMDDSIEPAGIRPFDSPRPTIANTTYYAEYAKYGPGVNDSARAPVEHILNFAQAENVVAANEMRGA